jgi:multimeric flavodoxin WrbA
MKITILNGSPNKKGNTFDLIKLFENECKKEGIKVEIIHVQDVLNSSKMSFCIACSKPCNKSCLKNTKLEDAFELLKESDGIIAASPVYFGLCSAQLKAFFDKGRYARQNNYFLGKIGAGLTVGASKYGGQETALESIHKMMLVHGMTIIGDGFGEFGCGHFGVCAQEPAKEDKFAIKRTKALVKRIKQEIELRQK